jgi:2-C-methyl-D-erythritol 4-phosphate cytidylyltransferase
VPGDQATHGERPGLALALIVAAGRGERLGAGAPKALAELAGRTLLTRSADLMLACEEIERVAVALPPGVRAPAGAIGAQGGAVRSASVASALAVAGPGDEDEPVVVHDAARPLATPALVRRTIDALLGDPGLDGAIAAAPVTDTVKRVGGDGVVIETLARSELWAVQTPQTFRRGALTRALDVPADVLAQATDDAWLIERAAAGGGGGGGGRVAIVPSSSENLKVTTPLDLALAELLIERGDAEGRGGGHA